jgi:hypothetical protein
MGFQDIYRFWSGQYVFSANSGKNARAVIVFPQNLRANGRIRNFMALYCILSELLSNVLALSKILFFK